MVIIDSTTVAVDTAADLKSVLEGNNAYTVIYLSSDIQLVSGITILPSKMNITIDGLYPLDGTGIIHTITDISSSSQSDNIGVRSASSITLTVQNLNIVGINYYGTFSIYEGSQFNGVTLIFDNVTYVGPEMLWNPNGLVRILDCDITIQSSVICSAQELGEVCNIEIGGKTTIQHTSTSDALFWFRGSTGTPYFTVLSGADVSITSANYFCYTTYPIEFTVQPNAKIEFQMQHGMFYNSSHQASFVLVDSNSSLRIIQNAYYSGIATFYCKGAFNVNAGAELYMQANFANADPLVYFMTGASLSITDPKSVVFYSSSATVFYFQSTTPISISGGQINYWLASLPIASAGTMSDIPLYSWRKSDESTAQITGSCTNLTTTVSTNNFTTTELAALPLLSLLQMQTAHVLSIGNLPLTIEPITDDQYPFKGNTSPYANISVVYTIDTTNYTVTGTADDAGDFSIEALGVVPATTLVTISVNIPFLITELISGTVSGGDLYLDLAPDTIRFIMTPVSTDPVVLLSRESPNLSFNVVDSRIRSTPWYLFAQIDGPLTTDNGHTLPDALVFLDAEGSLHILNNQPLEISTGEGNGGITTTTPITWDPDKGILLQIVSEPFYNGEEYTAPITWTLSSEPL